jgi:hypothetical protein
MVGHDRKFGGPPQGGAHPGRGLDAAALWSPGDAKTQYHTMGEPLSPRVVSRAWAIRTLREFLMTLTDEDHSMCRVATDRGIFCQGFRKLNEPDLRKHFAGIVERRPGVNRWQLEALGNQWELARQTVNGLPLACDVEQKEHGTCRGWDDFTNADLTRFCLELLGQEVIVTSQGTLTPPDAAG